MGLIQLLVHWHLVPLEVLQTFSSGAKMAWVFHRLNSLKILDTLRHLNWHQIPLNRQLISLLCPRVCFSILYEKT